MSFILNKKQSKAIRILQDKCAFLSDKDVINALEYNTKEGVNLEENVQK